MTEDPRHSRIGELLEAALELPAEDRHEFLRGECADDPDLLREVEELLVKAEDPSGPIPPGAELQDAEHGSESASDLLLERLAEQKPPTPRYRLVGEMARGGMGAILRVWDAALRRHLAMKVVLGAEGSAEATPRIEPRRLARFLEEAQITGQLDHPGIVPVHELGIDDTGRVFFTMRLVKGWDLDEVLRFVREGTEGWTRTRALGVLLKICEAMAYAHDHHVVHRDLKPSNVKVGRYGDVYVMDWGLGRVMDREDVVDVRPDGEPALASEVHTYREDEAPESESTLTTRDGDVLGTPAYMSPEQARGDQAAMGPHSDVYAVGAILYELLAGHEPYHVSGPRLSAYAIWRWVLEGPPRPLDEVAPDAPPELVAICEKAMARDIGDRFADMGELSAQLRAFLEGRVVSVHKVGPLVELKKWIHRNPFAASALAAALLAVVFGVLALWWGERREVLRNQLEADVYLAGNLLDEAPSLWPTDADRPARFAAWERECEALLERRAGLLADAERGVEEPLTPERLAVLDALRARRAGLLELERKAVQDPTKVPGGGPVEDYRVTVAWEVAHIDFELSRRPDPPRHPARHGVDELERVLRGELDALSAVQLPRVRARFRDVRPTSGDPRWERALSAIAADPRYAGLSLSPQEGLLPIGPDPDSGLWEFWLPASGSEPRRDPADGRLHLTPESGLVLVLVPGGEVQMGMILDDPTSPAYVDPAELPSDLGQRPSAGWRFEGLRVVTVAPFLLSKFELTQAQWFRLAGTLPSAYPPGDQYTARAISPTHPIESVTWRVGAQALSGWSLELPTEAQWVQAAGGTDRLRWEGPPAPRGEAKVHIPVDHTEKTALGFYALRDNVHEWCRDWYAPNLFDGAVASVRPGTGELIPLMRQRKSLRGGGFRPRPMDGFRCDRLSSPMDSSQVNFGLRPARSLR